MKIYVIPTDTCLGLGCYVDDKEGYELLYQMKERDKVKPLAILVPYWDELEEETLLNTRQVDFLKSYKFPFTVVTDVRNDFRVEYDLDDSVYDRIGFRVGEACLGDDTLPYIQGSMFLTSANISGDEECQSVEEIQQVFGEYDKYLKVLPGVVHNNAASNVISFQGDSTALDYLRKNYP